MAAIGYATRPAKHIQRQLVFDACRRLTAIAPLSDYSYVGFGGLEFVDFALARRQLGIHRMVSMERDTFGFARYEFNRPFAEVEVMPGKASDLLPTIDFSGLRIVWLDYEQALDEEVIADCVYLARVLQPGSMFVTTVNAAPATPRDRRRADLVERVGEARIPAGTTDDSLAKWGLAATQRRILLDEMTAAFRSRGDGGYLHQLVNICYADTVTMQTIGGLVLSPALVRPFETCRFEDLDFVRQTDDPLIVRAPLLTPKELIHLNRQLPRPAGKDFEDTGLGEEDATAYESFYRWYPSPPLP